jgi:hypothetical protein
MNQQEREANKSEFERRPWNRIDEVPAPYTQYGYISSGTDVVAAFKSGYGWHLMQGNYPSVTPSIDAPLYQGTPVWWMPWTSDGAPYPPCVYPGYVDGDKHDPLALLAREARKHSAVWAAFVRVFPGYGHEAKDEGKQIAHLQREIDALKSRFAYLERSALGSQQA